MTEYIYNSYTHEYSSYLLHNHIQILIEIDSMVIFEAGGCGCG